MNPKRPTFRLLFEFARMTGEGDPLDWPLGAEGFEKLDELHARFQLSRPELSERERFFYETERDL